MQSCIDLVNNCLLLSRGFDIKNEDPVPPRQKRGAKVEINILSTKGF
jgi:hypothetical protein